MDVFSLRGNKMRGRYIQITFWQKRKNLTTPSTGEKRSSSLSLYKKGTYLQIGPMECEALRGGLTNHIYSTTLLYKYDYYEMNSATCDVIRRRA